MMPEKSRKDRYYEWACRILLTVHCWFVLSGYIAYLQTQYQLVSPLIPRETIRLIAEPYIYTSLCMGGTFLVAVWLYFLQKKLACIIVSSLSVFAYKLLLLYLSI
jgi:hypothetical protein